MGAVNGEAEVLFPINCLISCESEEIALFSARVLYIYVFHQAVGMVHIFASVGFDPVPSVVLGI